MIEANYTIATMLMWDMNFMTLCVTKIDSASVLHGTHCTIIIHCCGNMCAGLYEERGEPTSSQALDGKWPPEKEIRCSATASKAYEQEKSCTKTASESYSTQTKAILCIKYLHDILLCLNVSLLPL